MNAADTEALLTAAQSAMQRALAPYSGFKVGAALQTVEGKIFTGCNIENPSLMLSECAERVALLKALSEGERHFSAIAIVSADGQYCYPCGSCRQLLAEFAPDVKIILKSVEGVKTFTVPELLPNAFQQDRD